MAQAHSHHHHGGASTVRRGGAHFDQIAERYNASLPTHVIAHYLTKRINMVRSLVPPPGPLLDVGCGTGMLAWGLTGAGYTVTGLDASQGMLEEAPMDRPFGRLLGSATHLPFRDGAFPAIITVAMLHHIAEPGPVAAAVREIVRVVAPGGAAIIWDHNPLNPYWPYLMRRLPQDDEDTRLVPAEEILAAVGRPAGCTVTLHRSGWIPEFAPAWSLPALQLLERGLEAAPFVRERSAHNVVVVRKHA